MKHALLLLALIIGLLALMAGSWLYVETAPGRDHVRKYRSLSFGMTKSDLLAHYGTTPDHTCIMGSWQILLYYRHDRLPSPDPDTLPAVVTSPSDIPGVYGAQQLLLNADGLLVAWTWNGETDTIVTIDGKYEGSDFTGLEQWFYEKDTKQAEPEPPAYP